MELFEFKFYKSYTDTFDNLTDEEAWKLLKRMYKFYFNNVDKKSDSRIVEMIFPQIKYTLEKSLKWKQTWWNRHTTPSTVPSRVPNTTPSTKDKDKDKDNIYKKQYEEFIKDNINKRNLSAYLLKYFLLLWYKPKEDIDKFRDWTKSRIIDVYKLTYWDFTDAVNKFYDYWIEQSPQKRTKKNWKSTFTSSFNLTSLPKNNV